MLDVLNNAVLVLNSCWQAVNQKNVRDALVDMNSVNPNYPGMPVAMGMIIEGDDLRPVNWEEWITLEPLYPDYTIHTPRMVIRAPTVIMAVNFKRVPLKRPNMCADEVYRRDKNKCQYSGRNLTHDTRSLDHVIPKSRGGKNTFPNVVACHKEINLAKGNKTPEEAGLRLLARPTEPRPVPIVARIKARHKDWEHFLIKQ